MGYDVSFHPISPEEIREWYFTPLTWIRQGQEEKVLALAVQHQHQISFQYNEYTPEKKKILKHDGYRYILDPDALE